MDILVTQRLVLRTPVEGDLESLHAQVLSDGEVMKLAFSGAPLSFEDSGAFFDANFDHRGSGKKLGVLAARATAEMIGFAGLMPCPVLGGPDYELGFVLRRSAWGMGYGTEIGLAQIDYGFGALGLERLLARVSPRNAASIATLTKIGMSYHSTVWTEQAGERQVYIALRTP